MGCDILYHERAMSRYYEIYSGESADLVAWRSLDLACMALLLEGGGSPSDCPDGQQEDERAWWSEGAKLVSL